ESSDRLPCCPLFESSFCPSFLARQSFVLRTNARPSTLAQRRLPPCDLCVKSLRRHRSQNGRSDRDKNVPSQNASLEISRASVSATTVPHWYSRDERCSCEPIDARSVRKNGLGQPENVRSVTVCVEWPTTGPTIRAHPHAPGARATFRSRRRAR